MAAEAIRAATELPLAFLKIIEIGNIFTQYLDLPHRDERIDNCWEKEHLVSTSNKGSWIISADPTDSSAAIASIGLNCDGVLKPRRGEHPLDDLANKFRERNL